MFAVLRLWSLWVLLAVVASSTAQAAEGSVLIVSSERGAAYQEASAALVGELGRGGVTSREIVQLTVAELAVAGKLAPRLIVTLGVEAALAVTGSDTRALVLCALLPRSSFERLLRDRGRKPSSQLSALYLNQPLSRQMDLIRLAFPQASLVGALFGTDSQHMQAAMTEAASSRKLVLTSELVPSSDALYQGLRRVLEKSDVLLGVPDPQIYNASSIQNVLLASFRARIPMLGFSPAYVRAGATLAIFSTPAQIGRQAGQIASQVLQGNPLPAPQDPEDFQVLVNDSVARSLDLNLDAQSLTDRLRRLEKRR